MRAHGSNNCSIWTAFVECFGKPSPPWPPRSPDLMTPDTLCGASSRRKCRQTRIGLVKSYTLQSWPFSHRWLHRCYIRSLRGLGDKLRSAGRMMEHIQVQWLINYCKYYTIKPVYWKSWRTNGLLGRGEATFRPPCTQYTRMDHDMILFKCISRYTCSSGNIHKP